MKTTQLFSIVLGIVSLTLLIIIPTSAQNLLDGVWFKVTVTMKGYELSLPDESVVGKANDKNTIYLYTQYDMATGDYTITSCAQNAVNPNYWIPRENRIAANMIKGSGQIEQIWNFHDTSLSFDNNHYWHYANPLLFLKGNSNNTVSLSTLGCTGRFSNPGFSAWSSCSFKGKSIPRDKVPSLALMNCEPF
jgi:hypothetical protein